eukprot:gb/GFBE01023073.1/.p1 GENE.gb/GFBE01023073.1/~~gb/GFBE01023073.1/.p1  ORF type:complete len:225 (+),score=32.84 gb/GFBE01023073.1/:1-675(+)
MGGLESDYPDFLQYREYLGNFSTHRFQAVYTIPRSGELPEGGRPLPKTKSAADHLAPGYYPVDRDFPGKRRTEEIPVGWLTRSARVKQVFMPFEDREKAIMRSYPGLKNPGPGDYYEGMGAEKGARSQERVLPSWTVPQVNKEGGRPLPRQKSAADHLGPGIYKLPNRFSELSWRKSMKLEKAARNNKDTWASGQYSQMFSRIKPGPKPGLNKSSSAPNFASTS